jgi:myo-inositol-1(or 4)-monophosphatase
VSRTGSTSSTRTAMEVAARAARAGMEVIQAAQGRLAGAGFGARRSGEVQFKGAVDMVTEVDLAAEAAVCAVLERDAPGVPILGEERGGARSVDTRWIVDPLDGTTNFVHGFPHYAVSVALEVDGVLTAGCIADPRTGWLAVAGHGQGATIDGARLQVSGTRTLDEALFLTGFAYDRRQRPDFYLARVRKALVAGQGLRRCGAATHDFLHIATGRADVYWELALGPWDVAAGILLVTEAGGRVTDLSGTPVKVSQPEILATNGWLHDEALALLADASPPA